MTPVAEGYLTLATLGGGSMLLLTGKSAGKAVAVRESAETVVKTAEKKAVEDSAKTVTKTADDVAETAGKTAPKENTQTIVKTTETKADKFATNVKNVKKNDKADEFDRGEIGESGFLDAAENWLGEGYFVYPNGRYVSKDGMRQIRYGKHETKNPNNQHGHFEAYDKPAQNGGEVLETGTVKILKD